MQVGGGIVNYQLHPITQFAELTLFIRPSYVVEKEHSSPSSFINDMNVCFFFLLTPVWSHLLCAHD